MCSNPKQLGPALLPMRTKVFLNAIKKIRYARVGTAGTQIISRFPAKAEIYRSPNLAIEAITWPYHPMKGPCNGAMGTASTAAAWK